VKLTIKGSGEGEVISGYEEGTGAYKGSPQIKCAYTSPGPQTGTCENKMSNEGEGYEATFLYAKPKAGSKFVKWTITGGPFEGCETFAGGCLPYVEPAGGSGTTEVTAEFALDEKFKLTVTKSGAGSGGVISSPAGINCGGTCSAEFEKGKVVKLTATPESGSEFRQWTTGPCAGSVSTTCEVTMTEARTVNAFFSRAKQTLTVKQEGTGAGSVASKPKGIKCGATCPEAVAALYKGTKVVLTAKAALTAGSKLSEWKGCESQTLSEAEGTCTVEMTKAQEVKVIYGGTYKAILNPVSLTLKKATGTGKGTVKASGIACEADCTQTTVRYTSGDGGKKLPATVTLEAIPAVGSSFSGWGSCPVVEGSKCKVTMSAAKSVTAQFTALPTKVLTVKQEGTGAGSVASKPKGIKCGATCPEAVAALPEGTTVVLTAKAALTAGSKLSEWKGCESQTLSEAEGTCTVKLSAAKEVKVIYGGTSKAILNPVTLTLSKASTGTGYGTVKASGIACEPACTSTTVRYTSGDGGKKTAGGRNAGSAAAGRLGADRMGQLSRRRRQQMQSDDERSQIGQCEVRRIGAAAS
jgi:hypothetical protein